MYDGSARSDYWNRIFSDVFDKPLHVPETAETTALGAAISAAVGCGMCSDFKTAVDRTFRLNCEGGGARPEIIDASKVSYRTGDIRAEILYRILNKPGLQA